MTVYVGPRGECQSSYTIAGQLAGNYYFGPNPVGRLRLLPRVPERSVGQKKPGAARRENVRVPGQAGPSGLENYEPGTQSPGERQRQRRHALHADDDLLRRSPKAARTRPKSPRRRPTSTASPSSPRPTRSRTSGRKRSSTLARCTPATSTSTATTSASASSAAARRASSAARTPTPASSAASSKSRRGPTGRRPTGTKASGSPKATTASGTTSSTPSHLKAKTVFNDTIEPKEVDNGAGVEFAQTLANGLVKERIGLLHDHQPHPGAGPAEIQPRHAVADRRSDREHRRHGARHRRAAVRRQGDPLHDQRRQPAERLGEHERRRSGDDQLRGQQPRAPTRSRCTWISTATRPRT